MSREVNIQILDITNAGYPKQMLEKEPVLLRRSEIIRQIKNNNVNITNEGQRLAISKTNEIHNNDISMLTSDNVMQIATVNDVQTVYDNLKAGIIDITVKYSLIFNQSGTSPYFVTGHGYPAGTTFVSGDLALAPYNQELLVGVEWFVDAGDRNGVNPVAGSAPLKGEGFPLYKYDGTGWLPCTLDTSAGVTKYKIKVINDYAYLCSLYDTRNVDPISQTIRNNLTNYYYMEYYPNTPSAGITRSVRFPKMFEIEARVNHMATDINFYMSNFNCGTTEV